jgi:hypothetical protein
MARKVLVLEPEDDFEAVIVRHPSGEDEEITLLGPDEDDDIQEGDDEEDEGP